MTFSHTPLLIVILILLTTLPLQAEILNVPADYETIQAGVDEAEEEDTVLVAPGRYVENILLEDLSITLASYYLITLNTMYIDSTIIDGDSSGSVIRITDDSPSVIGFTLKNGSGSYDFGGDDSGGGVLCYSGSPLLSHLKLIQNNAEYGGGMFFKISSAEVENCQLIANRASVSGGGIFCSGSNVDVVVRKTLIYNNTGVGVGGGYTDAAAVVTFNRARCSLDQVTVVENDAPNGAIVTSTGGKIMIRNSIVWNNTETQILVGVLASGDTVVIDYSLVQDGSDSINVNDEAELIYGENIIDNDPLFSDAENGDFRLSEDSPAIDAGDPNTQRDFDGTRADMGAFPYFHGTLIVNGTVTDFETGDSLSGASILTSYHAITHTDSTGFWQFSPAHWQPFTVTASLEGYISATSDSIFLEIDETQTVNFALNHSELLLSVERVSSRIDTGELEEHGFTVSNSGNGTLEWLTEKHIYEAEYFPNDLRESMEASEITENTRLYGIAFDGDYFYISGNRISENENNKIYILDTQGNLTGSFDQPVLDYRYSMRDLSWDSENETLWGTINQSIYGLNIEGDSVTGFNPEFNFRSRLNNIAWDNHNQILWTSGILTDIYGFNRDGELINTLDRMEFRTNGLAYWEHDLDGYQLYLCHDDRNDSVIIYKMNIDTGDTMLVTTLYHPDDLESDAGGIFIYENWDKYSSVLMHLVNDSENDRLDIWQLDLNTRWMLLEPSFGFVQPEQNQELTLTLNSEDLLPENYRGSIHFVHNGMNETVILPVSIAVRLETETDFILHPSSFTLSAYPNPFNSSAKLTYTVPQPGLVTLKLFDITGREVEVLQSKYHQTGSFGYTLDAGDLTAGVYLIELTGSHCRAVSKLALLK